MATLDLQGAGHNRNTLKRTRAIAAARRQRLRTAADDLHAQAAEHPRPDSNAFSRSDIDFRVQGEHVYFDRLNFNGDAISLLGKGEMDMQSEIHLAFTADRRPR